MTEKTTAVPTELIEQIRAKYPLSVGYPGSPLAKLIAVLPTPPKVGDTLTRAQIEALPPRSVIKDEDSDIWIKGPEDMVSLVAFDDDGYIRSDGGVAAELAGYSPVLVYLPSA